MKKFAKMSLVAAVAVAGLTSYASAGSLEEAIKDTSISGYVRYRMNTDHENDMDTRGETKLVVAIKTKVNDNVTATVKTVTDNNTASKPDGAYTSDSDAKAFEWNQAYFTYANGPLTVMAGRLGLVSPMTDNANSGMGTVATYKAGPVTIAGAYYLDTDKIGGKVNSLVKAAVMNDPTIAADYATDLVQDVTDASAAMAAAQTKEEYATAAADYVAAVAAVTALNKQIAEDDFDGIIADAAAYDKISYNGVSAYGVGVMGSIEMVNLAAWYMSTLEDINDSKTDFGRYSGFSLSADATFGPIGANILYAEGDLADASLDISYLQAGLSGSFGIVSASLDYVKTGEDSGDTTFDGDTDAAVNLGLLKNDMMLINDADAWHVGVSAAVTPEVTLAAHYLAVDGDDNSIIDDAKETELNATYQMSKNFKVTGRYSFGDVDSDDFQNSRVELLYTF